MFWRPGLCITLKSYGCNLRTHRSIRAHGLDRGPYMTSKGLWSVSTTNFTPYTYIYMESLTRPHRTQCLLLCLGISLLTSGQTTTRITYRCPCTVLLLCENSAQPNWTGVRDYLGGCTLIEMYQRASFCHLLFEKFKGLLLLWSKLEECLFPCQPSQWFG